MKEKAIVIATVLAATMLMAVFTTTTSAYADQQSTSVNDCGNGDSPVDVFCQELTSQIIGADNDVELDGDQD